MTPFEKEAEVARLMREIFPGLVKTKPPMEHLSWDHPDVVKRFREVFDSMSHEERFDAARAVLADRERLKTELEAARGELHELKLSPGSKAMLDKGIADVRAGRITPFDFEHGFDLLEAEDDAKQGLG